MISFFLLIVLADETTINSIHAKNKGVLSKGVSYINKKSKLLRSNSLSDRLKKFKSKIIHPINEKKEINSEKKDIYDYIPAHIIQKEKLAQRSSEPIDFSNRKLPEIPDNDDYMDMNYNPIYENVDSFCSNDVYENIRCSSCPEGCLTHMMNFRSKNKLCWYYKYTNGLIKKPAYYETRDINKTFDGYCAMTVTESKVDTLYEMFCKKSDLLRSLYRSALKRLLLVEGRNCSDEIKYDFLLKTLSKLDDKALCFYEGYKYHKDGVYVAIMLEDFLKQLGDIQEWGIHGCKCTPKCEIIRI